MVTMPVMVLESKTMASNGMEMCSGKIGCGRATQGTIGFKPRGSVVGAKIEGDFSLKQGNVATFGCNVATFQRGKQPTSRRSGQRRDVPERVKNQRHDVQIQRSDVPEEGKINVATLVSNVATF